MPEPWRWPAWDWAQVRAESEDEQPTWAYRWPAGERFAADLPARCLPPRVCDLGCGQGRLGLQALACGVQEVLFCDGSRPVLDFVDATLAFNNWQQRGRSYLHRWGDPLPGEPWPLILGGDILYRPECFAALLASISSSLTATGQALLSDPRQELEAQLPALAAAAGLHSQQQRCAGGYTLLILGHA